RLLHERRAERDALTVAEQARARAFLDLLASRDNGPQSRIGSTAAHPTADRFDLDSADSGRPFSTDDLIATAARLQSTILSYWVMPDATLIWTVGSDGSIHGAISRITASRLRQLIAQA